MSFFDLFRRTKKPKYSVDKTPIEKEYIESRFQFLIDSGYKYVFYQKNWEREFVYTLQERCVEVYLDGNVFDCVIQTKDFPRSNITKNPLVTEGFKDEFYAASNRERINMTVNLLQKHSDLFMLK